MKLKNIFLFIIVFQLLLMPFNLVNSQNSEIEWNQEIKVSDGDNMTSIPITWYIPPISMKIDKNDNVHVAWNEIFPSENYSYNHEIFYKKLDKYGRTLVEKKRLTFTNNSPSTIPSILIDSENNIHVIYSDFLEDFSSAFYYIKLNNNGSVIINNTLIQKYGGGSYCLINYPQISTTIDSQDNIWITWTDNRFTKLGVQPLLGMQIYFMKINKNGGVLINGTRLTYNSTGEYSSIAIDKNNSLYIAFLKNSSSIYYRKLDSNGNNLTSDIKISDERGDPKITVDSENNLHAIWNDNVVFYKKFSSNGEILINNTQITSVGSLSMNYKNGYNHIFRTIFFNQTDYIKLNNNGEILINTTIENDTTTIKRFPSFAIDSNNYIHLVYQKYNNSTQKYEIYYKNNLPLPDLTPSNISLSQTPYENQIITISSLIKNIGKGNATNFTVSLIINNNFIENKTISLLANSSLQISFNWTVLRENHEIKIAINKDKKIIEKNETNNEIKISISVLPDLTPILFTSHEKILQEYNMTIFALIKNIGNANAENFIVKFYINKKEVKNFTISLNFNENKPLSFSYNFEKGNHTIRVVVDENDLIEELNEENNEMSLEIVANEKVVGGSSFYMNFFIIIGISIVLSVLRKMKRIR